MVGAGLGVILPSVGCQLEYGGMTLPSGRYMHDDVQYFPGAGLPLGEYAGGGERPRMRAMGIEPPPAGVIPEAMGTEPGVQQAAVVRPRTSMSSRPADTPPPGVVPGGAVPMGPGPARRAASRTGPRSRTGHRPRRRSRSGRRPAARRRDNVPPGIQP